MRKVDIIMKMPRKQKLKKNKKRNENKWIYSNETERHLETILKTKKNPSSKNKFILPIKIS
jgi:hypothetical protein